MGIIFREQFVFGELVFGNVFELEFVFVEEVVVHLQKSSRQVIPAQQAQ